MYNISKKFYISQGRIGKQQNKFACHRCRFPFFGGRRCRWRRWWCDSNGSPNWWPGSGCWSSGWCSPWCGDWRTSLFGDMLDGVERGVWYEEEEGTQQKRYLAHSSSGWRNDIHEPARQKRILRCDMG